MYSKQEKKTIVFLLPSLGGGGSERVFLNLCKHIDKDKYHVTLCLLKKEGKFIAQLEAEDSFEVHDLGVSRVRNAILPIIKYVRRTKPDILISTLGHLNALLGAISFVFPKRVKLIGRESNIVSMTSHDKITLLLYKRFYKNFDRVIVQSLDMENDLKETVGNLSQHQVVKINNPVDVRKIHTLREGNMELLPKGKVNLVSVGSLTFQKGYDMLLKSFSKFYKIDNYHLTIVGEGNLKDRLFDLAKEIGIEKKVTFAGFQDNPYMYMAQASIFVSSSRFEGFPNVVLEALACDTPVIANDYKGGINEIIEDSTYGKIIDIRSSEDFESACETLLERDMPKGTISNSVEIRYGIQKITKKYEKLFDLL